MVTNSDGVIAITTSDDSVATGSYSNGVVTISCVDSAGECDITIHVLESLQYTAYQTTVSVTSTAVFKTFDQATDAELVTMVNAADAGKIDLYDDCGWRVEQERTISIGATPAIRTSLGNDHAAQSVVFTLMHKGQKRLTTSVLNKDGTTRNTCSFIVGMKDCLAENDIASYSNSDSNNNGWNNSYSRSWCNNSFKNAIPSNIRSLFKQFVNITGKLDGGTESVTTNDYFSLYAEKEMFGSSTYADSTAEGNLFQFAYNATHKTKKVGSSNSIYWERSTGGGSKAGYTLCVTAGGSPDYASGQNYGISVYGCI